MAVSEQIIQVLNDLCSKFGIAVDWTSENVVPYLNTLIAKLVSYEIWTSVAWIAIFFAIDIVWLIFIRVYRDAIKNSIDYGDIFGGVVFMVTLSLILVNALGLGMQIFDIIKCVTFPEMYVFEYIQAMINAGS